MPHPQIAWNVTPLARCRKLRGKIGEEELLPGKGRSPARHIEGEILSFVKQSPTRAKYSSARLVQPVGETDAWRNVVPVVLYAALSVPARIPLGKHATRKVGIL